MVRLVQVGRKSLSEIGLLFTLMVEVWFGLVCLWAGTHDFIHEGFSFQCTLERMDA